jgi:hypothetical protein
VRFAVAGRFQSRILGRRGFGDKHLAKKEAGKSLLLTKARFLKSILKPSSAKSFPSFFNHSQGKKKGI